MSIAQSAPNTAKGKIFADAFCRFAGCGAFCSQELFGRLVVTRAILEVYRRAKPKVECTSPQKSHKSRSDELTAGSLQAISGGKLSIGSSAFTTSVPDSATSPMVSTQQAFVRLSGPATQTSPPREQPPMVLWPKAHPATPSRYPEGTEIP